MIKPTPDEVAKTLLSCLSPEAAIASYKKKGFKLSRDDLKWKLQIIGLNKEVSDDLRKTAWDYVWEYADDTNTELMNSTTTMRV